MVEEEEEREEGVGEGEELGAVEEELAGPAVGETGKVEGGEGVGTAMGTPTQPLPLFSLLLLRLLLLGWLPSLLPLYVRGRWLRVAVRAGLGSCPTAILFLVGLDT